MKRKGVIGVLLVFSLLQFYGVAYSSSSISPVAFRMDDVQDYWLRDIQLSLLNTFLDGQVPVTLGLISGFIGSDIELVDVLKEGYDENVFELAYNGFGNEKNTDLSYSEQLELVTNGTERLRTVFGSVDLVTFIPPMQEYNQDTVDVCAELGFTIISSDLQRDSPSLESPVKHFPQTVDSASYSDGEFHYVPFEETLINIQDSIDEYGYAIVTLHPQQFAVFDEENNYVGVNSTSIDNFKDLMENVKNSYLITKIANLEKYKTNQDTPGIPGFSIDSIILGLMLTAGALFVRKETDR